MPERALNAYTEKSKSKSGGTEIWDPPFEDANDIAIKAMCLPATVEPLEGIPILERKARLKKNRWSQKLLSNTSSNVHELTPTDIGY